MATRRLLFLSVLLLALGVFLLFQFGHGNAAFTTGWPISVTNFTINLTTGGLAAFVGFVLSLLGLFLLGLTVLSAIVGEIGHAFSPERKVVVEERVITTPVAVAPPGQSVQPMPPIYPPSNS